MAGFCVPRWRETASDVDRVFPEAILKDFLMTAVAKLRRLRVICAGDNKNRMGREGGGNGLLTVAWSDCCLLKARLTCVEFIFLKGRQCPRLKAARSRFMMVMNR